MLVVGVDEAGKGPVIGPLVVAAVIVESSGNYRETPNDFSGLGLRDSKKIDKRVRDSMERKIKEKSIDYNVVSVTAEQIDELRRVMTMNDIMVKAFTKALKPIDFDVALLDAADVNEDRFADKIQRELDSDKEFISKHGADDIYPVVSAASILAKVQRDREIKKLEKKTGRVIGTGYPHDKRTIRYIENHLKKTGDLPPNTRRSWKTATRLLKKYKQKNLSDYDD
ncbi:ribonuclease HII [Methanonatronarchaeum sp. AMET-Sl]|uniref:ribonuclease HII n=1 Tax=Methanonatronarchaeum sp. AMET-Sl TaxID=3037654 RepID=UPI00244E0F6E|nr:ribonuclease HII [Methanonatronarchaeum sp. AMET-Sl]WGI16892.1 ribonuclease HII [Methanonatronarchaeum sp. AMET-Sl]